MEDAKAESIDPKGKGYQLLFVARLGISSNSP
jgi:hypothetical protein